MIIDTHVHVTENGKWFNTSHDASLQRILNLIDKKIINKAVLLPIDPYISNEFIVNTCREYPDLFYGFCSVNPKEKDSVNYLDHYISNMELQGLKLHPKLQDICYYDDSLQSLFNKAVELDIPVTIDAWVKTNELCTSKLLDLIVKIAKKHNSCKLIIAHLGGYAYNKIPEISRNFPNIYFDLSYIFSRFNKGISRQELISVISRINAERLLFGTDFPEIIIPEYISLSNEIFTELNLTKNQKDLINSINIQRILSK